MNEGIFQTQLNDIESILKSIQLLKRTVIKPRYPTSPGAEFRPMTYFQAWDYSFANDFFHFQLQDDSLLHFRCEAFSPLSASFSYLDCPYNPPPSYEDFVFENFGEDAENIGDAFREDFENYCSFEKSEKTHFLPIRYDYAPSQHNNGRHPASHIHFGCSNEMRVGTKKILRPISFCFFIIRQIYPDAWHEVLELKNAGIWTRNIRENLDDIDKSKWNDLDEFEMYLL